MGADSIIVNAAFKEALSRAGAVVPDMSSVIEGQVEISKTYLRGITDVFANIKKDREETEAAQNIQLQAFKAQAKKAAQHILKEEQSQPMKLHDAIYDKFKALEEQFKLYNTTKDDDTPENEKMRADLYAQLQMIQNQAVKSRGVIAKIGTMVDDIVTGNYLSVQDLAVGRAIMSVDGNYENIELYFNEKNQLTYLVQLPGMEKAVEWTIDDFNDKIIAHNRQFDVYTQQGDTEWLRKGLTGELVDEDLVALTKDNYIKDVIRTERDFIDAAYSKMNGRKSWVSSLYDINENTVSIATKAIEYLFTEDMMDRISLVDVDGEGGITMADMDRDGDNKITEADLDDLSPEAQKLWQANIESIISALTKPKINGKANPAFNLDRSSSLLGDYYMDGLGDKYDAGKVIFENRPRNTTKLSDTAKENISKRNRINALVAKEDISISDIESITLEGGVFVEQEGNLVHFKKRHLTATADATTTLKTVNIKDKEGLRTALWNYGNVADQYRRGPGYSKMLGGTPTDPFPPDSHTDTKSKSGVPRVENAKENRYYLGHNGKTYLFVNGRYEEISSVEESVEEIEIDEEQL